MREDVPSLTAVYVAFMRALATQDRELSQVCSDPCALALLPRALRPLVEGARGSSWAGEFARRLTVGLEDHIALRTGLIDAALEHAMVDHHDHPERGSVEQVVLLGAGFDARAHRLKSLARAVVFEVDHPATQGLKKKLAKPLPVAAREIRYAACDFARTRIEDALARSGFDPNKRSVWIWEGVSMYLPATAVVDSVQTIARLSAAHSMLIATYVTPEIVSGGELIGRSAAKILALMAEPLRFVRTPDELAQMLAHADLEVLSDNGPQEAAPHFGVHVVRPTTFMPAERIAVAIKKGNQT